MAAAKEKSKASPKAKKGSKAAEEESGLDQRIRIKIKAYDNKVIDQSTRQIVETAQRSGASVAGPIPLPTERHRYTVNKSSFIDKKSREQFEMRIHKRLVDIVQPQPKTIDALMSLTLPAGVDIEIKM